MILLGDAFDWIGLLFPLILFVVWVLNQLFGKLGQAEPERPPARPRPAPAAPRAGGERGVNEEIESFLRRVAQQRAGQEGPPGRAEAARPPVGRSMPRPEYMAQSAAAMEEVDTLVEVEEAEEELVRPLEGSRIGAWRTTDLVSVDNADEEMADHLNRAFGHPVGTLAGGATGQKSGAEIAQAAPSAAAGIAALLRDPRSLRHAVMLQEVLRRPEQL